MKYCARTSKPITQTFCIVHLLSALSYLLLQTKDVGFQVSVAGVVEYSIPLGNDAAPVEKEKRKKKKREKKCKFHPITYHEGIEGE